MKDRQPYASMERASMAEVVGVTIFAITGFHLYTMLRAATGLPLPALTGGESRQIVRPPRVRAGRYTPHEPLGGSFTDDLIDLDLRSRLL